jgi:hypothetical protein
LRERRPVFASLARVVQERAIYAARGIDGYQLVPDLHTTMGHLALGELECAARISSGCEAPRSQVLDGPGNTERPV